MKQAGICRIAELAEFSTGAVDRVLRCRRGIGEVTRKKVLGFAKQPADTGSPCDRIFRPSEE